MSASVLPPTTTETNPAESTAAEPVSVRVQESSGPFSVQADDTVDLRWMAVLKQGLRHRTWLLEADRNGAIVGRLPLALVSSPLFGRFLVSLPYVNSAGISAVDQQSAHALIDRAIELADQHKVRFLELRQEREWEHPLLAHCRRDKVIMRRPLPATADELWKTIDGKVRNQVRKGQKNEFTTHWGRDELLHDFYDVFAQNMRDLGTPVFGRKLFQQILQQLEGSAEICVLRDKGQAISAAMLVHHHGTTEVPSASCLWSYRPSNVNMVMYWELLVHAIERGSTRFDFGRSSVDGSTYRFKEQWGGQPDPSIWQYYDRSGSMNALRPDNAGNQRLIKIWKKLPLWLTRLIGPEIVRGIP